MKKRLLIISLLFLGVINVFAFEIQTGNANFDIGYGKSIGSGTYKTSYPYNKISNGSYTSNSTTIRLGYYLDRNHKWSISSENTEAKFSNKVETIKGWNFDYYYIYHYYSDFKPFINIGAGYYTYENTKQNFEENKDLTGISFNSSIGMFYDFKEFIQIESGLRFKFIKWNDINYKDEVIQSNSKEFSFYIGINYYFPSITDYL